MLPCCYAAMLSCAAVPPYAGVHHNSLGSPAPGSAPTSAPAPAAARADTFVTAMPPAALQRPAAFAAIAAVAETPPHSPSKPFLVRPWVGAHALTGQLGQPARGSSATTCSPRLAERVKGWALRCSGPDRRCAVESAKPPATGG
jgi:hypothetical protein